MVNSVTIDQEADLDLDEEQKSKIKKGIMARRLRVPIIMQAVLLLKASRPVCWEQAPRSKCRETRANEISVTK